MFSFLKKKYAPKATLSFIQTDMHNHVLPGVDDGAQNLSESLAMMRAYAEMGWKKVVATPHINESYYPNTPAELKEKFEQLQAEVNSEGIRVELELAAEYQTDALFRKQLDSDNLLSFHGNRILIELPFFQPPLDWKQYFFDLQMKGYIPVLAHAERYLYWRKELEKFDNLQDRGVELQLNLSSLIGKYGPEVQSLAEELIQRDAFRWVATDAHCKEDLTTLRQRLPKKWPATLKKPQYQNNVNYAI